jgi:TonB family protein
MFADDEVRKLDPAATRKRPALTDLGRKGMLLLVLAGLFAVPVVSHGEDSRKIKSSVPPEYPELARRLNIRGVARVQATIAQDGAVTEVKELGGNPVLVEALIRAVKKWKYEAASGTSVIEVKFEFAPQ